MQLPLQVRGLGYMDRLYTLVLGVFFAALAGAAAAQTCTPLTAALTWQGNSTALLTVSVTSNGAIVVPVFTVPFAGPGTLSPDFCFADGCYTVTVTSNVPLNGDLLDVEFEGDGVDATWVSDGPQQWVFEVCVGGGGSDCPDAIDYAAGSGCAWAFEIGGFVAGEAVVWDFGDGTVAEGGHYVTHTFPGNGVYVVTAEYSSDLCPDGVVLTTEVVVEGCAGPPCAFPLVTEDVGCNVWEVSLLEVPAAAQVLWTMAGAVVGDGTSVVVEPLWDVIMADCAPVVAQVSAPGCPTQAITGLVCEENCVEECVLELTYTVSNSFFYLFTASGVPEGAVVQWWVDGTAVSEGLETTFEIGFDFNPNWTVCASYVFGDCAAEDCIANGEPGCAFDVVSEQVSEGVWVFTAVGPGGVVWPEPVDWEFAGGGSANGNPVAWTWPELEGVAEVCATAEASANCPKGATACLTVESAGLPCEEVTLILSAAGITATGFGMSLTFEADGWGMPVGGWDLGETLECEAGWAGDTLTFCLPALCFSLGIEVPESAWAGLGGLVGEIANAPVAWSAGVPASAFGVNPLACSMAAPAVPVNPWAAYPVPASDAVMLSGGSTGPVVWTAVALSGRVVAQGAGTAPLTLDVSGWTPGVYHVTVANHSGTFVKKVVVAR